MIDKARIRRNVRRLRLAAGMSPTELAYKAGMSASMLMKIECGERGFSLDSLGALSRALKCEASELFL